MTSRFITSLKRVARSFGLEISRARPKQEHPLIKRFEQYDIQFLLDIGANQGQACEWFRTIGYEGPIVSVEPLKEQFQILENLAKRDGNITALNYGIGAKESEADIYVSGGSGVSSSFRKMSKVTIENAPEQRVVGKEIVRIITLDGVVNEYCPKNGRGFLKLDVQGYENEVLKGAQKALDRISGLMIEMSIVENYEGETLLYEMMPKLYEMGYRLVEIAPVWRDLKGEEIFQVDGTFFKVDDHTGMDSSTR